MQDRLSSHPLSQDAIRRPLEHLVSSHTGQEWQIRSLQDMRDFACHPAAIISNGDTAVFVKLSEAENGFEQFETELVGLRLLSEKAGVLTPATLGILEVEGGALLVLEAVQQIERGPRQWRQIGQTLARIHQVKGSWCGLETQGYFGVLYQDNRPLERWVDFFAERRLRPRLAGAIDSGHLQGKIIRQMEMLIARLPELCGPEMTPVLLHGDAQQNNFISTEAGAVVIDPAVCYGNAELDLAFIDYFQPVPEEVFAGYREIQPVDPGFAERRELWRIYGYLAAVTVEGAAYLGRLTEAVEKYV